MKKLILVALVISSLTASVASAITANDAVQKACIDYYPVTFLAVPNLVADGYAYFNKEANKSSLQVSCMANFIAPLFACAAYYAGKQPNMIPGGNAGKWGSFFAAAALGGYISECVRLRAYKQKNAGAEVKIDWPAGLGRGLALSALGLAAVELPKYATGLASYCCN